MRFLLLVIVCLTASTQSASESTSKDRSTKQRDGVIIRNAKGTEITIEEPDFKATSQKVAKKLSKLRKLTKKVKMPQAAKKNQLTMIQNMDDLREQLAAGNEKMSIKDLQLKEREINGWVSKKMKEYNKWTARAKKRMLYIVRQHQNSWAEDQAIARSQMEELYQSMLVNHIKRQNQLRTMFELQVMIQKLLFDLIASIKNRISMTMSINMTTHMLDFITRRRARYYRAQKDGDYLAEMQKLNKKFSTDFKYDQTLITVA